MGRRCQRLLPGGRLQARRVPPRRSAALPGHPGAAEQAGEGEAYRAAYALVRGQQFDQAVRAFKQFLQDYPRWQVRAQRALLAG